MARRISQQEVEKIFSERGAKLLSTYVNNQTDLYFECSNPDCSNVHRIRWANLKQGDNPKLLCPNCNTRAKNPTKKQQKYTIDYFREKFDSVGAKLLSTEYVNCKQSLDFICSNPDCGNEYSIIAWDYIRGQNKNLLCPDCNKRAVWQKDRKERTSYNLEDARKAFAALGAELLAEEYSYTKPMNFICSSPDCNKIHKISYGHFLRGDNPNLLCPECNPRIVNKDQRYAFLKDLFASRGAELLSQEYSEKLEFICSQPGCGRKHSIYYKHLMNGVNPNLYCELCMKGNMANPNGSSESTHGDRKFIDDLWLKHVKEFWGVSDGYSSHHIRPWGAYPDLRTSLTNGYPLLREHHLASYIDDEGIKNPFHMRKEYLFVSNYPDIAKLPYHIYENFKFINLDAYIVTEYITATLTPDVLLAKKKGYAEENLLYIPFFFEEILTLSRRKKLYSMLRARLYKYIPQIYEYTGATLSKKYARKLKVKQCRYGEVEEFFERTHAQGPIGGKVYLGLFENDALVSAMIFGPARDNKHQWELLRYSCELDTIVVGGASKLFKFFIKNYSPDTIVSYCDLRFSSLNPEDTMYPQLGFKFSHYSRPNYRYYKEELMRSFSRQVFQKHKLKDSIEIYDENLTEEQNMLNNGYIRLYDCGNMVFIWRK